MNVKTENIASLKTCLNGYVKIEGLDQDLVYTLLWRHWWMLISPPTDFFTLNLPVVTVN